MTSPRRIAAIVATAAAALALAGCADTTSRAAFQAYYTATAQDQRAYIAADPALSAEQKARRYAAIEAAGSFLEKAKEVPK